MPKSKEEIYALFSPKFLAKRKKSNPKDVPAQSSGQNNPIVARSLNILPTQEKERLISPSEGRAAVNGQAKKLDIRSAKENKVIDAGVAAIPLTEKKKRGKYKKETTDK